MNDQVDHFFRVIDSDDSGLVSRRELEQLLVQGGATPAAASELLKKIFKLSNLETTKHVNIKQFRNIFTADEAIATTLLEQLQSVIGNLPSSVRADRIFKLIDVDDSKVVSRRDIEKLMIQGGLSPSSATVSTDRLFTQAHMGNISQVTVEQFVNMFVAEKEQRGAKEEDKTLKWFESLVEKIHSPKTSLERSQEASQSSTSPVWFEKPILTHSTIDSNLVPELKGVVNIDKSKASSSTSRNELGKSMRQGEWQDLQPSELKQHQQEVSQNSYTIETPENATFSNFETRMKNAFRRLDIDGNGEISRHELEHHMTQCKQAWLEEMEKEEETIRSLAELAFESVAHSKVKPSGVFTFNEFGDLFRTEGKGNGFASETALLSWFEKVASRLPEERCPLVTSQSNQTPPKMNSFLPSSLSQYNMEELSLDCINEGQQIDITPRFTTPPTTAVSKRKSRVVDGLGPISHVEPKETSNGVNTEAVEFLGSRLEQVAQRAELRKQKKREKLGERAKELHQSIMCLKQKGLKGDGSPVSNMRALSLSELVVLLRTCKNSRDVPTIANATKSAKEIFDQVPHERALTVENFQCYALKEIDLRGDRSCDDMLRWLERLVTIKHQQLNELSSDSTDEKRDCWKVDEADDVDANGQPMLVALEHGEAEMAARKSMRRKDSFTVPMLENTPKGSSIVEVERQHHSVHSRSNRSNSKRGKTANAARSHYLRTAVDPIMVPLLDAVVHQKPRNVRMFAVEHCLKELVEQGTESDKVKLREMMSRVLGCETQDNSLYV